MNEMTPHLAPASALPDSDSRWHAIDLATRALPAPVVALSAEAWEANIADLLRRAGGVPIRIATKSVRVRALLERLAARPGFQGLLAYTLPEALWLAETMSDIVVGYPTTDRAALRELALSEELAGRITVMVDDIAQLDIIDSVAAPKSRAPIRICLDLDASLRTDGGEHFGVRRSPLHSVADLRKLAETVVERPGFLLDGIMAYEAQIAGVANRGPERATVRSAQERSWAELLERRAEAVGAVRSVAPLRFVNGGGTGSLERTATDPSVTELCAGSGLFGPHLFDEYEAFRPAPALGFGLDVVRRPTPHIATVLGGGWVASGRAGADRLPLPVHPRGLELLADEGAGEVQTPVIGPGAADLRVGDRVWFRHAKAGEAAEHANEIAIIGGMREGDACLVEMLPTFRGEGRAFL